MTLVTAAAAGLAGCRSDPWARYEASLYTVLREPSPETVEAHALVLEEIVATQRDSEGRPPPGLCVEYALYLDRTGRGGEAAAYLDEEAKHYPESSAFLRVMDRLLAGKERIIEETDHAP